MRNKQRFILTSEQCELLLEFENSSSLSDLAKKMLRDVSVVSRGMRDLSPLEVVEKKENRWVLTSKGRLLNNASRAAMEAQARVLGGRLGAGSVPSELPTVDKATALIVVGVQIGFDHPQWGLRNNASAEECISSILACWRSRGGLVVHVRHHSTEPRSPLREGTHGCAFKAFSVPSEGEMELVKSANCAFIGTALEGDLRARGISKLVVVGFSANHCVDATVRVGSDLGFLVTVVSDACVAYDRVTLEGTMLRAEEVHRVVMANLNQEFATVIETRTLLASLKG